MKVGTFITSTFKFRNEHETTTVQWKWIGRIKKYSVLIIQSMGDSVIKTATIETNSNPTIDNARTLAIIELE